MSTPNRTIEGLTPRPKADPKRLIAGNRTAPEVGERAEPSAGKHPETAGPPDRTAGVAAAAGPKQKVSAYIDSDLRAALRAAYRATAHLDGDTSFSAMVEKALAADLKRRQDTYNDGKPFDGSQAPLPSGRPLAD